MTTPVTPAVLQAGFQNFNLRFNAGRKAAKTWWNKIAMRVPSGTEEEIYAWLQGLPKVRKWEGNRVKRRLGLNSYRLKNEKFEQTITIDRSKFADDKLGMFAPMFAQMGREYSKFPDHNIYPLLKNGATNLCWDGKAFFADDHPVDPQNDAVGTYDNKHALALNPDNFALVYAYMQSVKAEDNEPMGITPNLLVVPPALRAMATLIVRGDFLPNTGGTAPQTNPNKDLVDLLVIPELAGADTTWYLLCTDSEVMPFIYQEREETGLVSRTAPDSEPVFERDEYDYGSMIRAAFGYGLPYLAAQSVG